MKWKLVAVAASIVPLFIIALLLGVTPMDIMKVGLVPFILSTLAAFAKLLIQGIRFHYYLKSFVGKITTASKSMEVRMASEFITLTTPSYTGGEFLRVAWLHHMGIHTGKGMWIITTEIISDVLVGSILAYMAALLALMSRNYVMALGIFAIITPIFTVYMILLILSSKKVLQMPSFTQPLLSKIFGLKRGESWTRSANDTLRVLCETSRENLNQSSLRIFIIGIALTFVGVFLHGLTFMVIMNTKDIGFFESLMAVSASVALGTIPITPGGSGLSEFGIGYYLTVFDLDPSNFGSKIIVWRLASYHLSLVISWIALMKLTAKSKFFKRS